MTLVEVLTAAVMLGVGVAGLLSAASLSLRNQTKIEHRAAAMCLAQEKLAEVELDGPYAASRKTGQGVQERSGVAYSWTLDIEPFSVGELYDVKVTVAWSAPGSSGQVELQTWLNDYESADLETETSKQETARDRGSR